MADTPPITTLVLPITGMDCGGCTSKVDRAVRTLPGIVDVEVSLPPAQALVQLDATKVTRAAVVEAIKTVGFVVPDMQA